MEPLRKPHETLRKSYETAFEARALFVELPPASRPIVAEAILSMSSPPYIFPYLLPIILSRCYRSTFRHG